MDTNLPPNDGSIVISTSRLTKAFGRLVAVNDLNLQVRRGDVFGFLGPNGSGKTTTIRMLLGLIYPTAGHIHIFGMDTTHHLPAILRRVGAIVETPMFYRYLSGIDNLRVVAANSGMVLGKANNHRLEEVLELVELRGHANMAYRKYSLGMKQRLGIAATLLTDPELVMLDEPTNGLDPAGMIEIRRLITRLSELGKTVLLSSHLLSEVQQVCNRVAILRQGNLVKQGDVQELLRAYDQIEIRMGSPEAHEQALALLHQLRAQGVEWLTRIRVDQDKKKQPIILLDTPADRSLDANRLLAQHELFAAAVFPREGTLEEIFMDVTRPAHIGPQPNMGSMVSAPIGTPSYPTGSYNRGGPHQ